MIRVDGFWRVALPDEENPDFVINGKTIGFIVDESSHRMKSKEKWKEERAVIESRSREMHLRKKEKENLVEHEEKLY